MKRGFSVVLAAAMVISSLWGNGSLMTVQAEEKTSAAIRLTDEEVETLTGETSQERVSVHDPSVVVDEEGNYYVFGSHMGVAKSTDLENWTSVTSESTSSTLFGNAAGEIVSYETAFTENAYTGQVNVLDSEGNVYAVDFGSYDAAAWISDNTVSGNMWAPDVIYNEAMGKWCMYLSLNGATWNSSIILLTADDIEGPYVYQGPIVFTGFSTADSTKSFHDTDLELVLGEMDELPERYQKIADSSWGTYYPHAIDPAVFYDEDGNLWMTYGSWSGGIYMLQLDENTGLRDYTVSYEDTYDTLGASMTSDPYFGTKIAGGYYVSGEGPYIEHIGNYYYLFISYGFYSPEGGYNMRVFRSETPDGPYVDENGNSAIYSKYIMNYSSTNSDYNYGEKLMGNYKWDTMDVAEVAQGHNSAFVDADGKAYVVYHTKFADGTASHEVRVHQLFVNEDGWLVAAPYEYSGETLSATGYTQDEVTGSYDVITHEYQIDYADLAYESPVSITLNADGTVTGDKTGTWTMTEGTPYAQLVLDGTNYKGVFTEQVIDGSNITTMCFTVVSESGLCVWGSGEPTDDAVVAQNAVNSSIVVPENTYSDIELTTEGLNGASISWSSDTPSVLADDGSIQVPDEDTTVTLTETISKGDYYYEKEYSVTVKAEAQNTTDSMVVGSYFTDEAQDLSTHLDGSLSVANPFYYGTNYGLDLSGGVTIEFDATSTGEVHVLGTILAFLANGGSNGRLYFTPGSYLGYNAGGSYFDANVNNYSLVEDYIGDEAHVAVNLTKTGFTVTVNDEVAYTEEILSTENGSSSITSYKKVLDWLYGSADSLYFGYGSWWAAAGYDEANVSIENVVCTVGPKSESADDEEVVENPEITMDSLELTTDSDITYISNPFKNATFDAVTVDYTIEFSEEAAKNGWDGIFSFYNSTTGGRVSFQTAPYLCFNDAAGSWMDVNRPADDGTNVISTYGLEAGEQYNFTIVITEEEISMYFEGIEIPVSVVDSGCSASSVLKAIKAADQFSWGVGEAVTSYWNTELCTLTDVSIIGKELATDTLEKDSFTITSTSDCEETDNPYYGKQLDQLYLSYTMIWSEDAAKNGWDGLFSFYNSTTGGRVSIQSAPYICYNDAAGNWIDINQPGAGGTNAATDLGIEPGDEALIAIEITKESVTMKVNGEEIETAENSSGATYEDLLNYISECDKLTYGVGEAKTAYWWSELSTVNNLTISPVQVQAVSDGNGTVTGSAYANEAELTATADKNFTFKGWYIGNICIGTEETITLTVGKNVTATAQFEAEETPETPAISSSYRTISSWGNRVLGEMTITNETEDVLKNWSIAFSYDGTIVTLWGAQLDSQENGMVEVTAPKWNHNLKSGAKTSFYFIAKVENAQEKPEPENVVLISEEKKDAQEVSAEVTLVRNCEWPKGYTGTITMQNNGSTDIEEWTLEFDYEDEITSLWGGEILSHEGTHYVIANAGYNATVSAGEKIQIGFGAKPADGENYSNAELKNSIITSVVKK